MKEERNPIDTYLKIKNKYSSWRNDLSRSISTFEDIAIKINSTKGKEFKFWCDVMDLYKNYDNI